MENERFGSRPGKVKKRSKLLTLNLEIGGALSEAEFCARRVSLFGDLAVIMSAGNAAKNVSAAIYLFHVKGRSWAGS